MAFFLKINVTIECSEVRVTRFAHWVIIYFGQIFENCRSSPHFWATWGIYGAFMFVYINTPYSIFLTRQLVQRRRDRRQPVSGQVQVA
jgi:hypothetical protein